MKVIVCLKEPSILVYIEERLEKLGTKYEVHIDVDKTTKLEGLFLEMEEDPNRYDMVFMDSDFDGVDGVMQAKMLRDRGYQNEIIFTSNNKTKVFDSFEVLPLFYILNGDKSDERLEKAFINGYKRMKKKRNTMLSLSFGGETRNIDLSDILYFESEGKLLRVYYEPEGCFQFYTPIGKIEKMLEGQGFVRIHKSIIVNAAKVRKFVNDLATLKNGYELPVSRSYYKANRKYMEGPLKG